MQLRVALEPTEESTFSSTTECSTESFDVAVLPRSAKICTRSTTHAQSHCTRVDPRGPHPQSRLRLNSFWHWEILARDHYFPASLGSSVFARKPQRDQNPAYNIHAIDIKASCVKHTKMFTLEPFTSDLWRHTTLKWRHSLQKVGHQPRSQSLLSLWERGWSAILYFIIQNKNGKKIFRIRRKYIKDAETPKVMGLTFHKKLEPQ